MSGRYPGDPFARRPPSKGSKRATRSPRSGRLVCGCRRGYASEVDERCFFCRGGVLPTPLPPALF